MVIDTGMVRGMYYDERRRISCLATKWISRASSKQVPRDLVLCVVEEYRNGLLV